MSRKSRNLSDIVRFYQELYRNKFRKDSPESTTSLRVFFSNLLSRFKIWCTGSRDDEVLSVLDHFLVWMFFHRAQGPFHVTQIAQETSAFFQWCKTHKSEYSRSGQDFFLILRKFRQNRFNFICLVGASCPLICKILHVEIVGIFV